MTDLYRKEALENTDSQNLGSIVLARPFGLRAIAIAAAILIVSLVAMATLTSYTRKISVQGSLQPDHGELKILATSSGIVMEIKAQEGVKVRPRQTLFAISNERFAKAPVQASLSKSVEDKISSLNKEQFLDAESAVNKRNTLREKLVALKGSYMLLQEKREVQQRKFDIINQSYKKQIELKDSGFISDMGLKQKEQELIDQEAQLVDLKKATLELDAEIKSVLTQDQALTLAQKKEKEELLRVIGSAKTDLIQSEANQETSIIAPTGGELVSLLVMKGQFVAPGQLLASIYPDGATLEAVLYVPSAAIGFVKKGSVVNLKYDSYPYQKFGSPKGKVKKISKIAIASGELKNEMVNRGFFYKLIVELPRQDIETYGVMSELRAGMAVQAEIEVETRKLYEWILDPIFSLKESA
ncbi:HlyD family secretion protein [Jeongeupia naejangsanensis]|uniref:HlyD family efflux transporter periplasmic adaptor subunit n=1 Tax=Jeongeupia naejangsanensis TaxID=613195 RepID=A0ABS2BQK6_9NEIS|nr:HlyD family efflux transporter periplasmic adaptor subunit [Jeongeupia naejangsanensis]MBM3117049.1 HlyD family efflux transporter periplasmic adaptor subunit [Jeongeupia naejangsanensis]